MPSTTHTASREQDFLTRGRQDRSGSVAATEALNHWKGAGVAALWKPTDACAAAAATPAATVATVDAGAHGAAEGATAAHGAMPLGKTVDYPTSYAPQLLFPVPRSAGRKQIGIGAAAASAAATFCGVDVWNCYECSWLDATGRPTFSTLELRVPATSPNLVESKSLKLYLNSLNFCKFASEAAAFETVAADVGKVCGIKPTLALLGTPSRSLTFLQHNLPYPPTPPPPFICFYPVPPAVTLPQYFFPTPPSPREVVGARVSARLLKCEAALFDPSLWESIDETEIEISDEKKGAETDPAKVAPPETAHSIADKYLRVVGDEVGDARAIALIRL